MTRSEARQLLGRLKIKPSRKLGQNFLVDDNLRHRLIAEAEIRSDERIVEIGPGLGAMTELLLVGGAEVIAIEYDVRLAAYLREHFAAEPRITVLQADAARVDYAELVGEAPWRCLGNLPYAVSSVIVARVLDLDNPPRRMDFVLQKEMAERLAAAPRTKAYGSLSVRTQMLYDIRLNRTISPSVFYPQPQVTSTALSFDRRTGAPDRGHWQWASHLIRIAFQHRRKKLLKALRNDGIDELTCSVAYEAMELSENVRAEELTVSQFRELAERIRAGET